MRNRAHYLDMLDRNKSAYIGVTLAARMIVTCALDREIRSDHVLIRPLIRHLKEKYGETLTPEEIQEEIGNSTK